jgi:hypothetical protein
LSRAQRSTPVVRCRPGTVTTTVFFTARIGGASLARYTKHGAAPLDPGRPSFETRLAGIIGRGAANV